MLRTVYLDDEPINVCEQLNESKCRKQNANCKNISTKKAIPDGYIYSEEFWKEADKRIVKVCKQYGVL